MKLVVLSVEDRMIKKIRVSGIPKTTPDKENENEDK